MENKKNINITEAQKNNTEIQANICYAYGNCGNCHWFDGNYHGGWCNKHGCDVQTYTSSCSDYWPE